MLHFTSVPRVETVTFSLRYCKSPSLPTNLTSEYEIPPLVFTVEEMHFSFLVLHLAYVVESQGPGLKKEILFSEHAFSSPCQVR